MQVIKFSLFLLLLKVSAIQAQIAVSISGPTNPNLLTTHQYYAEFRNELGQLIIPLEGGVWTVYGGNVISTGTEFAYIEWTSAGPGQVYYENDDGINYYFTSLGVDVVSTAPPIPSTTFTFERYCGTTKVIRNSEPTGTGVDWYWQTSSSGESTLLGTANNITVSTGPLYLRAKSAAGWSENSLQVTGLTFVTAPPAAPSGATNGDVITNGSASVALSVSAVSGATGYRWYEGNSLTMSTVNPTYSPTVSSSRTFHVAAVQDFCESATRIAATANVYPEPIISTTNNARITAGNLVILSVNNFTYDDHQWFKDGETSFTNGATFEAPGEGVYKVRVKKGTSAYFETANGIQIWEGLGGQNVNYIVANTIQESGVLDAASVTGLTADQNMQSVQYFDGLGRLMQTVLTRNSPQRQDVVQPTVYDQYGRETHKYLPYVVDNTGLYKSNFLEAHEPDYPASEQYMFYSGGTAGIANAGGKPFAVTRFEDSPLNRVLEQGAAGSPWQPDQDDSYSSLDRTVKFSYEINGPNEVVLWTYNFSNGTVTAHSGTAVIYYDEHQLHKKRTKDEQFNEVIEYVDKEGKTVLKRVQAPDNDWADTYYIYDDFGNLVMVLPPEAVKALIGQ